MEEKAEAADAGEPQFSRRETGAGDTQERGYDKETIGPVHSEPQQAGANVEQSAVAFHPFRVDRKDYPKLQAARNHPDPAQTQKWHLFEAGLLDDRHLVVEGDAVGLPCQPHPTGAWFGYERPPATNEQAQRRIGDAREIVNWNSSEHARATGRVRAVGKAGAAAQAPGPGEPGQGNRQALAPAVKSLLARPYSDSSGISDPSGLPANSSGNSVSRRRRNSARGTRFRRAAPG